MQVFIGIDPGLSGAIACIVKNDAGETLVTLVDTPIINGGKGAKNSYNIAGMARILEDIKSLGDISATIEQVSAMPGQGVSSMFNFGKGYGIWLGLLAGMKIPYSLVSPVRWKKALLSDMTKDKAASRLRAGQLFPNSAHLFPLVKHDGRAEALLIAEYGRRHHIL